MVVVRTSLPCPSAFTNWTWVWRLLQPRFYDHTNLEAPSVPQLREVTDIVLNSALNDCVVVKLSGVVQRDIKDVCQSSLISRPDSNPLLLKWMAIHSACKYIYMCLFRVLLT
jgi:hypothetical protein